jgi:Flp pilus assembly pilin Flp
MRRIVRLFSRDTRGQDLIEYALMAGLVVVAAAAFMPSVAHSAKVIFDRVRCVILVAQGEGYHWESSLDGRGGTCLVDAPKGGGR